MFTEIINGINVNYFLNEQIKPEKTAITELKKFLDIKYAIENLKSIGDFMKPDSDIEQVAVTPDFHKGSGIPIGTVMKTRGFIVPAAMGNDINCGMRLYITDLKADKLKTYSEKLEENIRKIFFEGARDIPMNCTQRESMLRDGLPGLISTSKISEGSGLWKYFQNDIMEDELKHVQFNGSIVTDKIIGLENYLGKKQLTYDGQIGTIGGGNHFVEVQKISEILNPTIAYQWGLKENMVVVMIHSGSLMIGHNSGSRLRDLAKALWPRESKYPENGVFPIPDSERFQKEWQLYNALMANAANFAFSNRMFLGLMIKRAISETMGEYKFSLLYDSPHNLISGNNDGTYTHREGACSARGFDEMQDTIFAFQGEPVMIPGSMGSSSYLLAGRGNKDSILSASHGAGRNTSRKKAVHSDEKEFREFIQNFKVITPLDPSNPLVKSRTDLIKKWESGIKEEAPWAYKNINDVIKIQEDNKMGTVIARMDPLMTIKN